MLKIILMTDDDPVDSWVAYQLAQQWPISHSIVLSHSPDHSSTSLRQKLLTSPLRLLSAIPRELISNRVESQREQTMAKQLWNGEKPSPQAVLPQVIEIPTDQINSAATAERIRTLDPDLILMCGGPILEECIFSIPRLGALNLQWGISDRYRGQHGIFYPLATGNFDAIGATVHRIDSGINTGEALLQFYPALDPGDTESSIEVKIAQLIVPTLIDFLKTLTVNQLRTPLRGKAIDPTAGQNIRYRDRTACLESQYQLRRTLGRATIPARPQRCDLFLKSHPSPCLA